MIKIVAFIHTYSQDREYGSFMLELINAFEEVGAEIHVIKSNDLVENLSKNSYKSTIDEKKLVSTIKEINPTLIFSSNHGGIGKCIKSNFKKLPIITWMVDRNPFLHHGGGMDNLFRSNDYIITSSTANVPRLEKRFPVTEGKVYYFPFMTNPLSFNHDSSKSFNVSFVGSVFVNSSILIKIIKNNFNNKKLISNIYAFMQEVKNNYDLELHERINHYKLNMLLRDNNLTEEKFLGIIANMISNNKRFQYLDAISDLGLELFGTKNWHTAIKSSPDLVSRFRFGNFIKTRKQLCSVYDKSKISININHHQATTGLGYRVFDIMASSSLLISNYQKKSDLEVLFGKDHPIPIYRSAQELRELVVYYLEHEDQRLDIVQKCNNLIKEKHTFQKRAIEIIQIVKKDYDGGLGEGKIIYYEKGYFENALSAKNNSKELTSFQRKLRKLKDNPRAYFLDSRIIRILKKYT